MVGVIVVVWWTKHSLPYTAETLWSISWENGSPVIDITLNNRNTVLLIFSLPVLNLTKEIIRIFVWKIDLKQ